jgi:hypothetical protein
MASPIVKSASKFHLSGEDCRSFSFKNVIIVQASVDNPKLSKGTECFFYHIIMFRDLINFIIMIDKPKKSNLFTYQIYPLKSSIVAMKDWT